MADLNLWLVRHAPVAGPPGVIHAPDAPADVSMTERLEHLRRRLPDQACAVCSPALRAIQTAHALKLDAVVDPAFREQDFGTWTGSRHDDLVRSADPVYRNFWMAPTTNSPPGGESFAEQVSRTATALQALSGGAATIVAHSGTVRAVLAVALGMRPERALSFVVDTLSLTRIDRLAGGWRVHFVNAQH